MINHKPLRVVIDTKGRTDIPRLIIVYLINEGVYETLIETGFPEAARMDSINRKISQVIDIRNFNKEPRWKDSTIFDVRSFDRPLVYPAGQTGIEKNVSTVFFSK